ncbi:unnamed protein product [Rotaria magnacalcarata]|uniref:G domain-containing protein n=2 Tax=Rotaria magnacalcarata TaxID=392030 RepID=A0A816QL32_9BILA|nr:unnamed protein product [Rotaria magnacalcarata]
MNEIWRSSSTLNLYKTPDGYPIERKVINASGRLGSLYDASTDNLIDSHSVQIVESKVPRTRCICRVFSGDSSRDLNSFLKDIDFDDAIRQSICLQMVTPRGISRFIEYNYSVNENTRFLHYSYRARKEWLEVTAHKTDRIVASPPTSTEATHMITKIVWGFEILCIIQIPKNHSVDLIDQLLYKICAQLNNNRITITNKSNNLYLTNQLQNITVYGSETCIDRSNMSLLTILDRITNWQKDSNNHQPLVYTMQPLRWLYNGSQFHVPCSFPRPDDSHTAQIEIVIHRINRQMKNLKEIFENLPINMSSTTLDQYSKTFQQKHRFMLDSYDHLQGRLRLALADIRRHRLESLALDDILGDQRYECLCDFEIKKFLRQVQQLLNKSIFIEKLKNDEIEYLNALDIHSNQEVSSTIVDIDVILERTYSLEKENFILWYSSDRLKREEENRYQHIYQELTRERQHLEQRIKIVYIDFTDVTERLEDFIFVKSPLVEVYTNDRDPTKDTVRILSPSKETFPKLKPIEMNVLLLGETSVEKSTFINYLKFESFYQSVTQQCQSYVFDLNHGLRLRFIDIPGIDDIRRNNQDVKSVDNILNYINNFSHLNAICLFLKPNTSELNAFFRFCVKPLLTYLIPNGSDNIIFCFTHTRATFSTQDHTDRLLRKMLDDEQLYNISVTKENTFYFDNESFLNVDEYQRQEYINSRDASVAESVRLLTYIEQCKSLNLEALLSLHRAALDISMLARPLMETMRLIIYNWKLSEANLLISHMVLNSYPIDNDICTNCAEMKFVELGPFWLTQYQSTLLNSNENQHLRCLTNKKHVLIESTVTYEFVPLPAGLKKERWQSSFYNFLFKCDRLLHFLRQQELSNQDDPFQPILERYLEEEEQISQMCDLNYDMNQRVREVFESIKQMRQENSQKLSQLNESLSLNQVYQIINEFITIPTVKKQIDSIKTSRRLKMVKQECIIPKDSINNIIFASFIDSHR